MGGFSWLRKRVNAVLHRDEDIEEIRREVEDIREEQERIAVGIRQLEDRAFLAGIGGGNRAHQPRHH